VPHAGGGVGNDRSVLFHASRVPGTVEQAACRQAAFRRNMRLQAQQPHMAAGRMRQVPLMDRLHGISMRFL
jgi:hypothetical protein